MLERWASEVADLVRIHGSLRRAAAYCREHGLEISHNTLGDWRRKKAASVDAYVDAMAAIRGRDPDEYRAWLYGRDYSGPVGRSWTELGQILSDDAQALAEVLDGATDAGLVRIAIAALGERECRDQKPTKPSK